MSKAGLPSSPTVYRGRTSEGSKRRIETGGIVILQDLQKDLQEFVQEERLVTNALTEEMTTLAGGWRKLPGREREGPLSQRIPLIVGRWLQHVGLSGSVGAVSVNMYE